jgi:LysR family transcriptional regulator, low CO2-responsive transcriptional regulator
MLPAGRQLPWHPHPRPLRRKTSRPRRSGRRYGSEVTPTQLRAFSAVVRLGSVKEAAAELKVTEAAVSLHIGTLRKELGDPLFNRTSAGLAFTPGGLRLARRATELLGLADRTVREVSQAGRGRRLLRLAASSLFAEYAAPGLIELFTRRAKDLDVEMVVCHTHQFQPLLASRAVDVAIGPPPVGLDDVVVHEPFLRYEVLAVTSPELARSQPLDQPGQLAEQTWMLGPSAVGDDGVVPRALAYFKVPEDHQRIFQSSAAALEETKRGHGVALAVSFAVRTDLTAGRLVKLDGQGFDGAGAWTTVTLPSHSVLPAAAELTRFISTPRAITAMLRGAGAHVGHFRPSVHITLWS